MTNHVKRFIEENIEDIDAKDWYHVFFSWYLHYGKGSTQEDYKNIQELFDVLSTAYPNIIIDSNDARMSIIVDTFVQYIHMKENIPSTDRITFGNADDFLMSGLGFREELKSHFRTAAKQCGYIIKGPLLVFDIR